MFARLVGVIPIRVVPIRAVSIRVASIRAVPLALLACMAGACQSLGGPFLIFGGARAPHDGLIDRAEDAGRESKGTSADFAAAFHLYQRLTSPQAVELEKISDDFEDAVEECEDAAEELTERIESIRTETDRFIDGWSEELAGFSSEELRGKSAAQMQETEARARRLLAALEREQSRMQPVLRKLKDYALFFHHNLNARAIATLQDTYENFDREFRALENETARAQDEITAFLASFEDEPAAR